MFILVIRVDRKSDFPRAKKPIRGQTRSRLYPGGCRLRGERRVADLDRAYTKIADANLLSAQRDFPR
ncbi:MAG: hypothetical protein DRQ37_05445 [Gammaproteobacteria bacterium]|nr:MAG: hypothetical protein DRQ37_05445 [Gammaproteobacteria bacterium]